SPNSQNILLLDPNKSLSTIRKDTLMTRHTGSQNVIVKITHTGYPFVHLNNPRKQAFDKKQTISTFSLRKHGSQQRHINKMTLQLLMALENPDHRPPKEVIRAWLTEIRAASV
ncbi:hypothetical protein STEG23_023798, partial [Scotinomys teguina]